MFSENKQPKLQRKCEKRTCPQCQIIIAINSVRLLKLRFMYVGCLLKLTFDRHFWEHQRYRKLPIVTCNPSNCHFIAETGNASNNCTYVLSRRGRQPNSQKKEAAPEIVYQTLVEILEAKKLFILTEHFFIKNWREKRPSNFLRIGTCLKKWSLS